MSAKLKLYKMPNPLKISKDIQLTGNFELFEGEKIAILGKNGEGKTSILMDLATHLITRKDPLRFGILMQSTYFQDQNKLYDLAYNIWFDLQYKDTKKLDQHFQKFDLWSERFKHFNELSGGQKQRFKLLIAFINNPNILLIDELTTFLDREFKYSIREMLKKHLHKDTTLVMVSHDLKEIKAFCKQFIFIENHAIKGKDELANIDKVVKNLIKDEDVDFPDWLKYDE